MLRCIDLQIKQVNDESINNLGPMIIIEIFVDTKDAMGANVVNTMCEVYCSKNRIINKWSSNIKNII